MKARILFLLVLLPVGLNAQTAFSKWIVQSDDSLNDHLSGDMELIRLGNGDLLNCACRDEFGAFGKCRFLRLSPAGDPVQQWELHTTTSSFWLNKVIENADGSFACFGRHGYASLYLHLDPAGTILTAMSYEFTGIGVVAPWEWNDAVQDPGARFTLAGDWNGMGSRAVVGRIEADGTLIAHDIVELGTQGLTFFNDVERMANGDHVFCGASNYPGNHCKTYLFKTDSVLAPLWAKAYPDSGYIYTYAKLLMAGVQHRIVLRERDPGFIGSTLMVAAASNGNPMWARRRLPDPDYPSMTLWPKTAHLTTGGTIAMAGAPRGSGNEAFIQVLNTNGSELGLVELDIPSPLAGCAGDAGAMYFTGVNHGPLGVGAYSLGLTKLETDLALCGEVDHNTTEELWFPSMDTT